MKYRMSAMLGAAFVLQVIAACASIEQLAPPIDETSLSVLPEEDRAPLDVIQHGRQIYITSCARCHSPESVAKYTSRQWSEILPRMAEKTPLNATEQSAVGRYIAVVLALQGRELPAPGAETRFEGR